MRRSRGTAGIKPLSLAPLASSPSRRALGRAGNGTRPLGFQEISKWRALLSRVGSSMAKNLLVGVGSKARKVKALYVGVGGKARKVKKVYVGVGGKARLVYTSYVAGTKINVSYTTNYETLTVTFTLEPSNATTGLSYTITSNLRRPYSTDITKLSNGYTFTFTATGRWMQDRPLTFVSVSHPDIGTKTLTACYDDVYTGNYWYNVKIT